MYDCGNEFLRHTFKRKLIKNEYRIKAKFSTKANHQANYIKERITGIRDKPHMGEVPVGGRGEW